MILEIPSNASKEEAQKMLDKFMMNRTTKKDFAKHFGTIKTEIDPLEYQKKCRNEWE